jgi:hypothetical protein
LINSLKTNNYDYNPPDFSAFGFYGRADIHAKAPGFPAGVQPFGNHYSYSCIISDSIEGLSARYFNPSARQLAGSLRYH